MLTHGLPNYSFPSTVDLVRELIDSFPEDFPPHSGDNDPRAARGPLITPITGTEAEVAVTRHNILQNTSARDKFRQAITQLKAEPLMRQGRQLTSADFGIRGFQGGPAQPLSTYDAFVLWHHQTMMTLTPPGSRRNAAHQGPVFLPWHRLMLLLLERNMQRVLNDPESWSSLLGLGR